MKFKDLLFLEQNDWGDEPEGIPAVPDDDNGDVNNPPLPADPDDDIEDPEAPEAPEEPSPPKPKKLSATQQVKQKWMQENPGVTEFQAAEAVEFFRQRKNNLRPYHPYGYVDPGTARHWINQPDITSLVIRFPEMERILSKDDQMKDLKNYPWEVMEFYMDMIQENQAEIADSNIIPGLQDKPLNEKLEEAKQAWIDRPPNVLNDDTLKIRKIESKHEAIVFGSVQRILKEMRTNAGVSTGSAYWCVTIPPGGGGRQNLWTNYRPGGPFPQGFYFVWDTERNESDKHYFTSVNPLPNRDRYSVVDLYNHTTTMSWDEVVSAIPKLSGKQNLFIYYDTTRKEKNDLTLDKVSFNEGNQYYLGVLRDSEKLAFVDSGRHINDVRAFSTLPAEAKKLYVAKTTTENNDVQTRFLCNDPANQYGILEFLRLETKPENLYTFLDRVILKDQLGIEEGVLAIKKLILGTNFDRWLSDDGKNLTLIKKRPEGRRDMNVRKLPYGIVNTETGDVVKSTEYVAQLPRPYVQPYLNAEGKIMRDKQFFFQKFVYKSGDGNIDQSAGFYMLYSKSAILKGKNGQVNDDYLKGQYYELDEGEEYINAKTGTGELVKI